MTTETPPYEPEARYRARVARPVKVGAFKYLPRNEMKTTGAYLNRIVQENGEDVIASADRI